MLHAMKGTTVFSHNHGHTKLLESRSSVLGFSMVGGFFFRTESKSDAEISRATTFQSSSFLLSLTGANFIRINNCNYAQI